jgi:hypothetical protein
LATFNPAWLTAWRVTGATAQHSPSGAQFQHKVRLELDDQGGRSYTSSLEVPSDVDSLPSDVLDQAIEIWKRGLIGTFH